MLWQGYTIEIKYPYCHHEDKVEAQSSDPRSCLISLPDGSNALDKQDAYYYQVQMQIFACNFEYVHFVLCTFPSESSPSIHIECILPDKVLVGRVLFTMREFLFIKFFPVVHPSIFMAAKLRYFLLGILSLPSADMADQTICQCWKSDP